MITAEELVFEIDNTEEQKNFKLGTVVELFENNTAKIQFDGEDIPSQKQYAYLDSYIPKVSDRILLGSLGGTYVILGKVNYNVSPSAEEEIDRYLFDLKQVIMKKGLNVVGGLETDNLITNNGATIVGNVGVNGSVNAVGLSASGNISGNNITIAGTIQHNGSGIGFFGKAPAIKTTLIPFSDPNTFTLNDAFNGINNIVNALKNYGLL